MIGRSCVNKVGGCSTFSLSEESAYRSLFGPFARRRRGKASKTKSESVYAAMDLERSAFHQLIRELEMGDVVAYKEFFRMTKQQFCFLLGKVSPLIQKKRKLVFSVRYVRHVFFNLPRSRASLTTNQKR